jgi:hypothetical protein
VIDSRGGIRGVVRLVKGRGNELQLVEMTTLKVCDEDERHGEGERRMTSKFDFLVRTVEWSTGVL